MVEVISAYTTIQAVNVPSNLATTKLAPKVRYERDEVDAPDLSLRQADAGQGHG